MSGYRISYLKSVILALGLGCLGFAAAALTIAALLRVHGPGFGSVVLLLVLVATLIATLRAGLVATGGLVALSRDRKEELAQPYYSNEASDWLPGRILSAPLDVARALLRGVTGSGATLDLRAGDWVRIRPLAEIEATLDATGALDGLPFMTEMAGWCGSTARVERRVDKLHDWIGGTGLRRVRATVQLTGLRCDGSSHGGCQANCHIRWKEAWLQRTAAPVKGAGRAPREESTFRSSGAAEPGQRFTCQATQLTAGSTPMGNGIYGRYVRDLVDGNVRPRAFITGLSLACFNQFQHWRSGVEFPFYIPPAVRATPDLSLNLRPGDFVRVRSKGEIELTLNEASRNRGLRFDPDMLRYCGAVFRVRDRIERTIAEASGMLVPLTRPSIILEGVTATGEYRDFNPENEWIFWREIWLERVQPPAPDA